MVLLPLLLISSAALPDGWREAKPVKDPYCRMPFEHRADLDGDGIEDTVRLLSRKDGLKLGLFVWLADGKATLIDSFSLPDADHRLGIGIQPPGTFKTWCGRDGWCEPGQPAWVKLTQPTIALVTCEASMSYLVWSPKKRNFRWVLMSD
ncbi:MAG: hypothetical protein QM817_15230 [Archangium sp.]